MDTVTVTVFEFKAHCADYLRLVEEEGIPVGITRNGIEVVRLERPLRTTKDDAPWLRRRSKGRLNAPPSIRMLHEIS